MAWAGLVGVDGTSERGEEVSQHTQAWGQGSRGAGVDAGAGGQVEASAKARGAEAARTWMGRSWQSDGGRFEAPAKNKIALIGSISIAAHNGHDFKVHYSPGE